MKYILILILTIISLGLFSQGPVGSWEDHLPYQSVKDITAGDDEIFAATDHAVIIFNKLYQEARKLSTVQGLSEYGVSAIDYSQEAECLIIAYSSTNIDIYKDGRVTNVPDIYNNYIAGKKVINKVHTEGRYAYLLSSFGIVLLDIASAEIYDTWNPSLNGEGSEVFDIAFLGNKVFASTDQGLMFADIDNPGLTYFGNWSQPPGTTGGTIYSDIEVINNSLFLLRPSLGSEGDSLVKYNNGLFTTLRSGASQIIRSLESSGNNLLIAYDSKIEITDEDATTLRTIDNYSWGPPKTRKAIIDDNKLYIADEYSGLVMESGQGNFSSIVIPGPYYNSASSLYASSGNVYVSGGLVDNSWDNTWTTFNSHFYENRKWWSGIYYDSWDVMRIRPFPDNTNKVVVSTWGSGIYIIENHEIVEHYNDSNSPLESIIPGSNYVRICGLAFDNDNRLWLSQTEVEGSIKVLNPDGSWLVLPYTIDAPTIGDLIISRSGKKWIILPRGHGLFVLDDNNSPENFGDDQWKKITVKDQDGKLLNNIYSICEDLDGNIWVGTGQGPAVYYNPDLILDENLNCYRIKIPRNDGSGLADYLLGTETINTIAVDGGNRKWIGTNSSGVYHISDDGRELIEKYNKANSPLFSNSITSIAIEEQSGEVWIGTDKGIITLRGEATAGEGSFAKVYAFPNPVRPDFDGSVTVTGLQRNTNVKFTDISGNLVYECTSNGGQATWDLNTYNGKRVSSGVYLALCSTEDGSESTSVKILIIR